jgi:hypothetical protein
MSTAFKCDRCGEFHDGKSKIYKVAHYHRLRLGMSDGTTILRAELCDSCATHLEEMVVEWEKNDEDFQKDSVSQCKYEVTD